MLKKMENNVQARTHPCLTPLEMGKLPDLADLSFPDPPDLSWSWRRMAKNLGGQPRCARIFHSPSWLTVSEALVRSTKAQLAIPARSYSDVSELSLNDSRPRLRNCWQKTKQVLDQAGAQNRSSTVNSSQRSTYNTSAICSTASQTSKRHVTVSGM